MLHQVCAVRIVSDGIGMVPGGCGCKPAMAAVSKACGTYWRKNVDLSYVRGILNWSCVGACLTIAFAGGIL